MFTLTKKFLLVFLSFALISIYSCSDEAEISLEETKVENQASSVDTEFSDQFTRFNTTLAATRTALNKNQQPDGTNPLVTEFFNANEDPEKLRKNLTEIYEQVNGKDIFEMTQLLKDYGTVNDGQLNYLNEVCHHLIAMSEEQRSTEGMFFFLQNVFSTTTLNARFQENEIPILQFLGVGLAQSVIDIDTYQVERTCDNWRQRLACAWGATVTAGVFTGIAVGVGVGVGTFDWCDQLLDILGFDNLLNVPDFVAEIEIPITENIEVSVEDLLCGAAITVGVWDFAFDWCCNTVFGEEDPCAESLDPCCGVNCARGYRCDERGDCVPIPGHCIHTGCPPNYQCNTSTGACYEWLIECQVDGDCPNGECCNPMTNTCGPC